MIAISVLRYRPSIMASAFPMARFSAGALSFRVGMDSKRWSSNQNHTLSLSLSHVTDTQGKGGRGKLGGNKSLAFSFNSALESTKRVQSIMVQSELTRGVLVFLLFSFRLILIRYPLSSWKWFSCKTPFALFLRGSGSFATSPHVRLMLVLGNLP